MNQVKRSEAVDRLEPGSAEQASEDSAHKTGVARGGDVNPEARHSQLSSQQPSPAAQPGVQRTVEKPDPETVTAKDSAADQEPVGPTRR